MILFPFLKRTAFWILSLSIAFILIFLYLKPSKWELYYQNKLGNPPHEIIAQAVSLVKKERDPPIALDFGAGAGNETLFLLEHGFRVIAIDNQPIAIKIMGERKDFQPYLKNLQTIESSFESLDWETLPQVDLFVAALSLPFCNSSSFKDVFFRLKKHIKVGGIFAGHFFDPSYEGFPEKDRQNMTFLNKSQVTTLLKDFEILHFKETRKIGKSGTGSDITSHIHEVIARKKNP